MEPDPTAQKILQTAPLRFEQIEPETLREVRAALRTAHWLEGIAIPGDPPVLGGIISPKAQFPSRPSHGTFEFDFATNLFTSDFGTSFILTFRVGTSPGFAQISVPVSDKAFEALVSSAGTQIVLFKNDEPFHAFQITTQLLALSNEVSDHLARQHGLQNHRAHVYFFAAANRALALHENCTRRERLAIGWAAVYSYSVRLADIGVRKLREDPRSNALSRAPETIRALLAAVLDTNSALTSIFEFMTIGWLEDFGSQRRFVNELKNLDQDDPIRGPLMMLHNAFLAAPRTSNYGLLVPCFSSVSNTLEQLKLEPSEFPPEFPPEYYWPRIGVELKDQWTSLVSGAHIPIDANELFGGANALPDTDDLPRACDAADALLDEAVSNKSWTIPPGAVVELHVGPFRRFRVFERGMCICFVGINQQQEFFIWEIDVEKKVLHYDPACLLFASANGGTLAEIHESNPKSESRLAAMKLLLSALIRDFWVVEERETVFVQRRAATSHTTPRNEDTEPRFVYLPRIRYNARPNTEACSVSLNQPERRRHSVAAHLRALGRGQDVSDSQQILEKRYGFNLPVGHTFVRPHERGAKKRELIYRSRSALKSLYTVVEPTGTDSGPVQWFQFERDVRNLMASLGFCVEHVAAGRRGDGGIDVYATKGTDIEAVHWIIQCKCWSPRRKISPGIVREMLGVLAGYPHGTRGMIVTTSSFSKGAMEFAKTNGMLLIDGDEFAGRVAAATDCKTLKAP